MEQSNGPIQQPLRAASADPGFVPGLTGVVAPPKDVPKGAFKGVPGDAVQDAVPGDAVQDAVKDAPDDASEDVSGDVSDGASEDASEDAAGASEDAPGEETASRPEPGDGPVFEAADRRGRIVADAEGVRLSYDEEACEFRWDELAAVESAKGRFGKRFTVTVHTPDRRWYPIEILAPDRGRVSAWEAELDEVLDAYFDETS
ncbi:hypothetical protein ACFVU3_12700 [Streptomyces sp. NPDC058052]|uniref:hypothetical protein n=1 Tax=Streptomyces sp. NPDC058052 TaxID=3346316 RepID=UPI0036ED8941